MNKRVRIRGGNHFGKTGTIGQRNGAWTLVTLDDNAGDVEIHYGQLDVLADIEEEEARGPDVGDWVRVVSGQHAGCAGYVVGWDDPWTKIELASGDGTVEVLQSHTGPCTWLEVDPDPVDEETEEPHDPKPRGVKRQWHLVPLRSLAVCIGGDARGLALAAGDYQWDPSADTAYACFAAAFATLTRSCGSSGPLDAVAAVFEHGGKKYGDCSWRLHGDLESARREYLSAFCRHALVGGSETDPESGLPHMAHACATAVIMLDIEEAED